MILKIFRCRVPASTRKRFLVAQGHWRRLQSVDGFLAQRCGFVEDDSTACVIVALWQNRASLERFMNGEHDRIVESGKQAGTYLDGRVVLAKLCADDDREMRDVVDRFMASDGVTLIEIEESPGGVAPIARRGDGATWGVATSEGALLWGVLESTASFIVTDFERNEWRSDGIARAVETRESHVRWMKGFDSYCS